MTAGLEIVLVEGERRIDSRLVAQGIHIRHDNLMQTIAKYQTGLERYGVILFQTGKPRKGSRGGRPEHYVLLNKEQFGYLLMFVRITQTVQEYRELVYDKFLEYERLKSANQEIVPAQVPVPQINSLWQQRLEMFNRETRIPDGYWCIYGFVAGHCWTDEFRDVYLIEEALPDGSIGKRWCNHVRERGYDMRLVKKYPHRYPDKRGVQQANIYPNEWLGEFWTWFHGQYLKHDYPEYLKTHMRALQAPTQKKQLPPGRMA